MTLTKIATTGAHLLISDTGKLEITGKLVHAHLIALEQTDARVKRDCLAPYVFDLWFEFRIAQPNKRIRAIGKTDKGAATEDLPDLYVVPNEWR